MFQSEALTAQGCCPSLLSLPLGGDLYIHWVITAAQCVTNEKLNETLRVDQRQGQGLSRIMKSPISSRSTGRFSLLHSMDAYRILYYFSAQQLCQRAMTTRLRLQPKRDIYSIMTGETDPCHSTQRGISESRQILILSHELMGFLPPWIVFETQYTVYLNSHAMQEINAG